MSIVYPRFALYNDECSANLKKISRLFNTTKFDFKKKSYSENDWNRDTKAGPDEALRLKLKDDFISMRSCYRALEYQNIVKKRNPHTVKKQKGVIVVHLMNIIHESFFLGGSEYTNGQKAIQKYRYMLILAERSSGYLKLKLFYSFDEKKLINEVKRFLDRLASVGLNICELAFVQKENPNIHVSTALNKSEEEIRELLTNSLSIEPHSIYLEPKCGYTNNDLAIVHTSIYQKLLFQQVLRMISNTARIDNESIPHRSKPKSLYEHSSLSIYDLALKASGGVLSNLPKVKWDNLKLELIQWNSEEKDRLSLIPDFFSFEERPLIVSKNNVLSQEQLRSWVNDYNLGKGSDISPPLALLWRDYKKNSDCNGDLEHMTFNAFRKKLRFYS